MGNHKELKFGEYEVKIQNKKCRAKILSREIKLPKCLPNIEICPPSEKISQIIQAAMFRLVYVGFNFFLFLYVG